MKYLVSRNEMPAGKALGGSMLALLLLMLSVPLLAAAAEPASLPTRILITNVNIFDGKGDELIRDRSVLVEGQFIKQVAQTGLSAEGATIIDGGGCTLMPGLIDAHWHVMYIGTPLETLANGDMVEIAARAVPKAEAVLLRGFTTVRDMGGPAESVWRPPQTFDGGLH